MLSNKRQTICEIVHFFAEKRINPQILTQTYPILLFGGAVDPGCWLDVGDLGVDDLGVGDLMWAI